MKARRVIVLLLTVVLLALQAGCATKSSVETPKKSVTYKEIRKKLSADNAVNILNKGTYFFNQRVDYIPDSQAMHDEYQLMDSSGIFPCYRKAQETIPLTNNEPNGEFWWCQATETGLKKLSLIPYPADLPPRGQQIAYIVRNGNKLLFIISGTSEIDWTLAYYDGKSTKTVVSSKDYQSELIKIPAEPWHIGLCNDKAYWVTFDTSETKTHPKNIAYIYSTHLNKKSGFKVEANNVASFRFNKKCDKKAIYYQKDKHGSIETPARIDLYDSHAKVRSFSLEDNISNTYGFIGDNFVYANPTTTNNKLDLIIENLQKHSRVILHDTNCEEVENINKAGDNFFYFTCTDGNHIKMDTYLYDLQINKYYIVPNSYAGFTAVDSEKCLNTRDCFLLSWSKTDYVIAT